MGVHVWVADLGRKHLVLRWHDPITRAQRQKTAGTANRKEAERLAGKLQAELEEGRYVAPVRISWEAFRERYEAEKLPSLAPGTWRAVDAAMNHLERVCRPRWLSDVNASMVSRLQAALRTEGLRDSSIAKHLRHLKAALNWAKKLGLINQSPEFEMPPRAKGKAMRGRPLSDGEFEQMLAVVPLVRPRDAAAWEFYLRGLWLSGLRLQESLDLSWEPGGGLWVDLDTGEFPRLRILAESEKGHKDRVLPMTPDFAELLLQVPADQREGYVFKLASRPNRQLSSDQAGRVISTIGERAGIVVNTKDHKFASAHDLRRSFGTRWARRVKPAVLMVMMRHESIETTMAYYVDLDVDDMAKEIWNGYHSVTGHLPRAQTNSVAIRDTWHDTRRFSIERIAVSQ